MNLRLVFEQGDVVLISVFMILILMSVLTWSIIVIRAYSLFCAFRANKKVIKSLNNAKDWDDAISISQNQPSTISELIVMMDQAKARYLANQKNSQTPSISMHDFVLAHIHHQSQKMVRRYEKGLAALASFGQGAPFIGLFGTVWGLYHALINISQSGQVNIAVVAGPIGEALIATAAGLFVAIPAAFAFNGFNRCNKMLMQELQTFMQDLHVKFI